MLIRARDMISNERVFALDLDTADRLPSALSLDYKEIQDAIKEGYVLKNIDGGISGIKMMFVLTKETNIK